MLDNTPNANTDGLPVQPEPELEFGAFTPEEPPAPATSLLQPASAQAGEDVAVTLSPAEREQINEFVGKIDLTDSAGVLGYGVGSQKKVSDFSGRALAGVRGRDLGQIGEDVQSLVTTLKGFDPEAEGRGLRGLFRRGKSKLDTLKARYDDVEQNVNAISETLEAHQRTLLKDISMLDQMYDLNETYFKELTMYIIAGKQKLEEVRASDLPALQQKAAQTGLASDAQAARDLAQMCDRFEKRVYDLELTRQIALQTAPQIRLIQNADQVMAEKIQSTVVNTIPLWKNQMVITLGVEHVSQAARAQREVTDMTNELLKNNAERLKVAAVDSAREAERGVVDIETLRHTNEQLVATLDDIIRVQGEGREKRRQAEQELAQIESELKQKLLEASRDV